MTTFDLEV